MLLLSGDVHLANIFMTPCAALTGYRLAEYTSSGLSHSIKNWWTFTLEWVESWQDPLYGVTRVFPEVNFGEIIIDPVSKLVNVTVRDSDGGAHL